LLAEIEIEQEEMKAWHTREISYFIVNSQSSKHIDREKIMILPSERKKIKLKKKQESEYTDRMLMRMSETTQR